MRVGVVAYICNSHSGARAPIELALALSKLHKIYFFATENDKDFETIKRLKKSGVEVLLFNNPLNLLKLFKEKKIDIISAHTTLSLLIICKISRIPILSYYYGTQFNVLSERFYPTSNFISLIDKILNLFIYFKGLLLVYMPDHVVGISKYTVYQAKQLYFKRISFIYLGSVPTNFKQKIAKLKNTLNLLSVSRITPYKGFDKIIKVFKAIKNRDLVLNIVGSSPQQSYLQTLRKVKPKNANIYLDLDDQKLNEMYLKSDIYLSADKYLFFGMPILEAAYFGKPAIVLNAAAAKELVIHGKSGYIAENMADFEKYLKEIIENKSLRAMMGKNARSKAQLFSWKKCAGEWDKLFRKYELKLQ